MFISAPEHCYMANPMMPMTPTQVQNPMYPQFAEVPQAYPVFIQGLFGAKYVNNASIHN